MIGTLICFGFSRLLLTRSGENPWCHIATQDKNSFTSFNQIQLVYKESPAARLQRCIATINRWTDYCNNREIIVSDYWLSQKHRKIIGPDGLEK